MGGSPSFVAKEKKKWKTKGAFCAEGLDRRGLFDSAQLVAVPCIGRLRFWRYRHDLGIFSISASHGMLRSSAPAPGSVPGFQSIGRAGLRTRPYSGVLHPSRICAGKSGFAITQLLAVAIFLLLIAEIIAPDHPNIRFLALQSNGNVALALACGQADTAVQTSAPILRDHSQKGDATLLG